MRATAIIEWGMWGRVELVLLHLPPQELWRRVKARDLDDPPVTREQLSRWYAALQRPNDGELTSYDAWSACS